MASVTIGSFFKVLLNILFPVLLMTHYGPEIIDFIEHQTAIFKRNREVGLFIFFGVWTVINLAIGYQKYIEIKLKNDLKRKQLKDYETPKD